MANPHTDFMTALKEVADAATHAYAGDSEEFEESLKNARMALARAHYMYFEGGNRGT